MNLNIKKIFSLLLILNIIFSLIILKPKKVEAFIVVDSVQSVFQPFKFTYEITKAMIQLTIDYISIKIKKEIIYSLVDDTINYINTGEFGQKGKPSFISNFETYKKEILKEAQSKIINELRLTPLCSPIKLGVQFIIPDPDNLITPRPPLSIKEKFACTFENIYDNIENFLDDFKKGGWFAYSDILKPENNSIGFILKLNDEIIINTTEKLESKKEEVSSSGGFLSAKECIKYINKYGSSSTENTNNPITRNDGSILTKKDIDELIKNDNEIIREQGIKCDEYKIVTPGSLLGEQVSKAIGSDLDFILSSDEISIIIAQLVDVTISRVFKEGLKLIKNTKDADKITEKNKNIKNLANEAERSISERNKSAENAMKYAENINLKHQLITKLNNYIYSLENATKTIERLNNELDELLSCVSSSESSTIEKIIQNKNILEIASTTINSKYSESIIRLKYFLKLTEDIEIDPNDDKLKQELKKQALNGIKDFINNNLEKTEIIILLNKLKEIEKFIIDNKNIICK